MVLLPNATVIVSKVRISMYDALYVALAEVENCEMVTGDNRLLNNVQKLFPFVLPVSALP